MKRGQLIGMPLILIFALIAGALILVWGVSMVKDLIDQANYVDFSDKVNDFKSVVESYGKFDEGSSKKYVLNFPEDVEFVCFYDYSGRGECSLDGESCDGIEMDDVFGSSENVYFFPANAYDITRFDVNNLKSESGNPECVSNGKTVLITKQRGYVSVGFYE